jgi:2-keto-4-pentenoate hydratase/2-oxohepta-3-ene-1,7-dioic acid hydratase in catechol pathway
MKWVKFDHSGSSMYGILDGDSVQLTDLSWKDVLTGKQPSVRGRTRFNEVTLLNPIECPGKIVCVGLNYMDHCRETNTQPPERPLLFAKFTTSLNGPSGDIVWSTELTKEVDFEAELAVIIGRECRQIGEKQALEFVAGYTAANDVSARDIQLGDRQWVRGKSLDTFCPLGPVFVTRDEISNPQSLAIRCYLNDVVVQDSNTSEMIFPVAHLVSFCSQAFTLEPGDVILTGTPHGTGIGREPKLYMQDGDTVVVEVEGIGRLENRCRVL